MDQNAKLQRTVEGFEEANVRLTEEIYELKNKLKSCQQITVHVRLLENELEDLKTIMKNLEDRNCKLQTQKRQLEKDHQNLSASISQLQEENGKLTVEKENVHWRNEELLLELVDLKNQLYEAKGLISVKDALLSELMRQDIEEETKELLQKISCLFYSKIIWDMYKGNLAPQLTAVMQQHQTEMDSYTRNGVKKDNGHPAAEYVKAEPHLRQKRAEMKVVSGAARMVECGTSPEYYNLHVDRSSQKEHNTRCATSSETMQVQRVCRGLCGNIDQQQSKLELRFEELFSSEQKHEGNICIRWNVMQTELAASATDVKHEDQLDSSIWFCSQTKNLCLVSFCCFLLMLVAYSCFFSFFPGCCQRM
ncbi:protein KASH5-like [Mobula hypostoma]|uniref:protein KASH5-like n=1 Tax=Mobula hypostoma TaxID=723540 RepID=UPI002FC351CF